MDKQILRSQSERINISERGDMDRHYTQRYGAVGECFANRNGTECKIMRNERCEGVCAFHKTGKELKRSQSEAFARLAGLSPEHQLYIAEKYYSGKMPWQRLVRP